MNPNAIYFQSKGFPEFRFMSNFHVCTFSDDVGVYRSVEHYYQAQKALGDAEREAILNAKTPNDARRLGQKVELQANWHNVKDQVMTHACVMKFFQNADLAEMLLATDGFELVEYAPWGDTYWGVGKDYVGENRLGKILMMVRDMLKEKK